jgi:para-nitrobenzyl esterase
MTARRSRGRAALWLLATALAALGIAQSASAAPPPLCSPGTTVQTAGGAVCVVTAGTVTSYLGIPYAAPPVGDLRWAPPQPARAWTGMLPATAPGNICPAPSSGAPVGNEDCLNLNVQAPADARPGQRLPVMVEIHGGGFLSTAFGALGDGTLLVNSGHVVYVAVNYRLGILGFLAERSLGAHSGDYGLQDQQAALRWVQRNIASFGGDPGNVTIFGQSAGGASVCDQVVSPAARGLFQRGISVSGFYNSAIGPNQVWEAGDCKSQLPTLAEAERAGTAFAAKVGCGTAADVAACLRAVPVQTLMGEAGGQVLGSSAGGTIAPTINGTTLPLSPGRAFATGRYNQGVGLMIGADRDEFNGGVYDSSVIARTPAEYRALLELKYGGLASTVRALYPPARFPGSSSFIAYRTAVAHADLVCPSLQAFDRLSRHIPVFAYQGDDADAPSSPLAAEPLGAYHDTEVRFNLPLPGFTVDANQSAYHKWLGPR